MKNSIVIWEAGWQQLLRSTIEKGWAWKSPCMGLELFNILDWASREGLIEGKHLRKGLTEWRIPQIRHLGQNIQFKSPEARAHLGSRKFKEATIGVLEGTRRNRIN